ncbi:MAG: 23S rRNA (uracil(1939)-C(5))-methyltransferase RlmD [Bacteroidales bacterium]|nr:23S rRNA (uracil(1939)-C(5))-methyltransferase RlmD [Bacteroidales bacterium]MBP8981654.1 23S rRNA (uracil(1939)-C(5))-methyltransferase RlmD [Bacteroidales bacterium]HOD26659.1 23S rRNA (uracil(1939)-C(5))-methyltransferase RlmD [Bacteroidales bacterium]HPB34935.1 23S rRNA (uracil(1939)-C(5))-methyltransferase RlmD [Bacteroidales bacterium]HPY57628.1 23S rRNA (uracil(1939)-C(5))-methyltransferase RlmD [Bacteroidales bacterium]
MAKKRKELPLLENVEIEAFAAEGKALARVDNLVVFVPFAAPGDMVDIRLSRKRKQYAEGRIVAFKRYSADRVEPFCSHFGVCGGCQWQHLPYSSQLKYKQQQVLDVLQRIAKVELPEARPILGSEKDRFYRNKLEYTFSNKRWRTLEEIQSGEEFKNNEALGFHIPGMFDKVLDIEKCFLQEDFSNRVRLSVKAFCLAHQMDFFDLKLQQGLMRNLIVRTTSTGQKMVIVVFFREETASREALLNHLLNEFPEITSLIYVINNKANDTIFDRETVVYHGSAYIVEEMEGLQFIIGPKSFYQTNSEQAYRLYSLVREFAGLQGNELVYDLYTGTGTIANFLARQCRKVIGIEYIPEAIEDARANAELNGIKNTTFFAADVKDLLNNDFTAEQGRPDVLITDPPRAGMHGDVVKTILSAAPERVVYVSCNPSTQARDLSLMDNLYQVEALQAVDMFPHTRHVENVVLLKRRQ